MRACISHALGVTGQTMHPGRWIGKQRLILKTLLKVQRDQTIERIPHSRHFEQRFCLTRRQQVVRKQLR